MSALMLFGQSAVALFVWGFVGLIVTMVVDNAPRYSGAFDELSPSGELLMLLFWPAAVPLICRKWRRTRR